MSCGVTIGSCVFANVQCVGLRSMDFLCEEVLEEFVAGCVGFRAMVTLEFSAVWRSEFHHSQLEALGEMVGLCFVISLIDIGTDLLVVDVVALAVVFQLHVVVGRVRIGVFVVVVVGLCMERTGRRAVGGRLLTIGV